jgi:VWFA-related protein
MKISSFFLIIFFTIFFAFTVEAQNIQRDFQLKEGGSVEITNFYGRVDVAVEEISGGEEKADASTGGKMLLSATSNKQFVESDLRIDNAGGRIKIEVAPADAKMRVDLTIKIPIRTRVKIKTSGGEVRVAGNLELAEVETETGTIAANVPLENLKYDFVWTESRPRFLSDVELEEVKEKAGGKFVLNGKLQEDDAETQGRADAEKKISEEETNNKEVTTDENGKPKTENKKTKKKNKEQRTNDKGQIKLNFTTARGIVLLNVNPNEVPSNLRERPLTEAAKAIIQSGDSLLTEAIRRASPKYFGDYAKTLPPRKREPSLNERKVENSNPQASLKKIIVRVSDLNNRAIANLQKKDFEITEAGEKREILSVEPTTAPFNLVLLLDVSGSVDNYVDFIRKAARNFVNTVNPNDKIAIIIFNEDIKTLSTFTTNKGKLSESLDTFDAGGGTAFYDALAYSLVETLKPLKGEKTAIVALSDGDDNRSFLSFESLLGSIQESGVLVYPLYVPSGLIAASAANNYNASVDPLRTRFMALTTKAESEGEKLAQVSGGVYYPIKQLSELQKAYDDIVLQLRTAYTITFRSNVAVSRDNRASPRLKIKVNRENAFVKLGSVVEVSAKEISGLSQESKK